MPRPSKRLKDGTILCGRFGHPYQGSRQCPICKGFAEVAKSIDIMDRKARLQVTKELLDYLSTRTVAKAGVE